MTKQQKGILMISYTCPKDTMFFHRSLLDIYLGENKGK